MSDRKPQNRVSRVLIVGAVVLGVMGGSYGIATAASGSDPAQPAAAATAVARNRTDSGRGAVSGATRRSSPAMPPRR
jgi:hypothetical protein